MSGRRSFEGDVSRNDELDQTISMNRGFVTAFVKRLISLQRNKEKDCGRESRVMKADTKSQKGWIWQQVLEDAETIIGGTMCHVDQSPMQRVWGTSAIKR